MFSFTFFMLKEEWTKKRKNNVKLIKYYSFACALTWSQFTINNYYPFKTFQLTHQLNRRLLFSHAGQSTVKLSLKKKVLQKSKTYLYEYTHIYICGSHNENYGREYSLCKRKKKAAHEERKIKTYLVRLLHK